MTAKKEPANSKHFIHDELEALVRDVNPRNELHGEKEVLCVDVSIWLAPGEGGNQWEKVLGGLLDMKPDPAHEFCVKYSSYFKEYKFAKAYEDHPLEFLVSGKKAVATFPKANINNFAMEFATDKHDDRMVFRIQAEASGTVVGKLSDLIGKRIRIRTTEPPQGELGLED